MAAFEEPQSNRQNLSNHEENDAQLNIMAPEADPVLNDFCLLQIFNYLDINDLCRVVNVCKQFKNVSVLSFSIRYKTLHYPASFRFNSFDTKTPKSRMRRVLSNFGHLIQSFSATHGIPIPSSSMISDAINGIPPRSTISVSELTKMKSLKVLELDEIVISTKVFNSVLELKTLTKLVLKPISQTMYSPLAEFFPNLAEHLPLLEELNLKFEHQNKPSFSTSDLRGLVKRLPKLSLLIIGTLRCNEFDQKVYDSLLKIIRKRSAGEKLTMKIYCRLSAKIQMKDAFLQMKDALQMEFLCEECSCSCGCEDSYDSDEC